MNNETFSHDTFSVQKMKQRYLLAIGFIAVIVISGHLYIKQQIEKNHTHGQLINVSAKQRMYSQRIAFFAERLSHHPFNEEAKEDLARLEDVLGRMERAHARLTAKLKQEFDGKYQAETIGYYSKSVGKKYHNQVYNVYFSKPYFLDNKLKEYFHHVRDFIAVYHQLVQSPNPQTQATLENQRALIYISSVAEDELLKTLNAAVNTYQQESEEALNRLQMIDIVMLALVLSVLLLETLYIFRPLLKKLEAKMEKLELAKVKAEEINRLKSDFLATMSHEIRTPMNGVLGMAELILSAKPSSQIEGYARTIIHSGESLLNIIDDILDFSKIEAGKLELEVMPVDILALSDEVARLYSVKARDKAVELAVRYMPGTEQFVYADPVRIRQVLGNLVSNAIKFTQKGHVIITVEEQKNASSDEETILLFRVRDTGIGISEEAKARIFEKFMQADHSTTRHYGGTGLGLSICQSLVQMMGGEIGVESREGEGSIFWFSLPLKRNKAEYRIQPKPPILQNLRVLVVDDLPVIREIVSEQLQLAGMKCETAECAKQALHMMLAAQEMQVPYHIAIIDYLMPDMNGEMLASMINDYPKLRQTCLVMLTAAGNPMADEEFVKKGFSAYIPKPVENMAIINSLSIIWEYYQQGQTNSLIHLDSRSLNRSQESTITEPVAPNARILLAEDNLINQIFIREILEEMEAECIITSNGQEAIEALLKESYDLVLMDCLMPVMDGFEATREICRQKELGMIPHELPVIALTANAMKGDRERCLESGMDEYLTKPVRKRDLKEMVHLWIYQRPLVEGKPVVMSIDKSPAPGLKLVKSEAKKPKMEGSDLPYDVLDKEAVEQACAILKDKYADMVTIYLKNSSEILEEIAKGLADKDISQVIRPAHTLKSSSRQMGASKLSDKAKDMELFAKAIIDDGHHASQEQMEYLKNLLQDMQLILAATRNAFANFAA